jgi:nucleoside-diphosphate-sugar epimerase
VAFVRVFVAGATGVLGRRLVRQLAARGHTVVGGVRDERGAKTVLAHGGDPKAIDLFDVDSLAKAAEGAESVVRAATSIPTKLRPSPSDWALNDRIRREGTRALADAAAKVGARSFLQESVVWAVGPVDGGAFDEDAPPSGNPVLASALDAERIGREAGARRGFETAVLRLGAFYCADGWHTRVMGEALARRRPVMIGPGTNVWSMVHVDDAASAFVAAVEKPQSGVWHVVDDRPAPVADFLCAMVKRLGAAPPRTMPKALARLVLGRYVAGLLTASFRTTNARFRRDFGWQPRFPTFEEGLDEVVSTWRGEGFPPLEKVRPVGWHRAAWIVIWVHLAVLLLHTGAHVALEILPALPDSLFILIAMYALPIASVAYLRRAPRAAWGLLLAFAASFVYGAISHFVIAGPDNAFRLPAGEWATTFQATTAGLAVLEGLGILAGAVLVARLRTPSEPVGPPA